MSKRTVSAQEVIDTRRHGDPHYVRLPDGALILVNPARRQMKALGLHGKAKKKFRRQQRASAKVALPTLEGLVQ